MISTTFVREMFLFVENNPLVCPFLAERAQNERVPDRTHLFFFCPSTCLVSKSTKHPCPYLRLCTVFSGGDWSNRGVPQNVLFLSLEIWTRDHLNGKQRYCSLDRDYLLEIYYIKNQLVAALAVLFISHCKITLHVSDAFCVHHQEY